jgi:hypothetical protein
MSRIDRREDEVAKPRTKRESRRWCSMLSAGSVAPVPIWQPEGAPGPPTLLGWREGIGCAFSGSKGVATFFGRAEALSDSHCQTSAGCSRIRRRIEGEAGTISGRRARRLLRRRLVAYGHKKAPPWLSGTSGAKFQG